MFIINRESTFEEEKAAVNGTKLCYEHPIYHGYFSPGTEKERRVKWIMSDWGKGISSPNHDQFSKWSLTKVREISIKPRNFPF